MQTFVDDSALLAAVAAEIAASTGRASYPIEWPADVVPAEPYTIVDPLGGQWDRGILQREHACGWYSFQVRSVGKGTSVEGVSDYLWLAGKVRAAVESLALTGSSWQAGDGYSEGLPSGADTAGNLIAVAETFEIYVQTTS